jgi:hypothetical protein
MFNKLPAWVEWVCCNSEGSWVGTKDEPIRSVEGWSWPRTGALMFDAPPPVDWRNSKRRRGAFVLQGMIITLDSLVAAGCDADKVRKYLGAAPTDDTFELTPLQLEACLELCKCYNMIRFKWFEYMWCFELNGGIHQHNAARSVRGFQRYVYEDGTRTLSSWRSVNGKMVLPIGFEYE